MVSGTKGRPSKKGVSRTHVLVYPGRVPNAFSYCSSFACMACNAQAVGKGCWFTDRPQDIMSSSLSRHTAPYLICLL